VLVSRSAMEHIAPVERALAEMARVVRPGGVIHLRVDPYFWLRGCHKRGLVDIPWAHARMTLEDFRRFVTESEGAAMAATRCARLQTLNRLTLGQWRSLIGAGPFGGALRLALRAIRTVRYKPGRRCLIEYDLEVTRRDGPPEAITLVAKALARGADTGTFRLVQALRARGFDDASPDGIAVPEP